MLTVHWRLYRYSTDTVDRALGMLASGTDVMSQGQSCGPLRIWCGPPRAGQIEKKEFQNVNLNDKVADLHVSSYGQHMYSQDICILDQTQPTKHLQTNMLVPGVHGNSCCTWRCCSEMLGEFAKKNSSNPIISSIISINKSVSQVRQTWKTKVNGITITQTVCCKHSHSFCSN